MYFPSGDYYVGDLCYVLSTNAGNLWDTLLKEWDKVDWHGAIEVSFQGYPVWDGMTAYGDGRYHDRQGRTYAVDSGSIGLLPLALCEPDLLATLNGLGHIIAFPHGCTPRWQDGLFRLEHLTIDTREEDNEEASP